MTNRELFFKTCELPAVPNIAVKIIKLIDDPHTNAEDLQKVIIADQALATRMLRMANSAFYGVRQKIDTISEAISIMGFKAIRILTLAISTRELYKRFGIIEQKLWEHSLGVSIASGLLAEESPSLKKEEVVVAGLLHDIGKVIMDNSQPERFTLLTQRVYDERAPFYVLEQEVFGFGHADAGFFLLEKWGFPVRLCSVISQHHSYDFLREEVDEYQKSLTATVALADALCAKLGIGYRDSMADIDLKEEPLREALTIEKERIEEITNALNVAYMEEKIHYLQ